MELVAKIILRNDTALLSDVLIKEFTALGYSMIQIHAIMDTLGLTVKRAHHTRMELEEMRRVGQRVDVPMKDILHAIVARDNDAILVSRDRHFRQIAHITKAFIPENLE